MQLHNDITRENLRILMTSFYEKAIDDKVLGPFFIHELGDDITNEDWVEHIELLADFWLAQLLGENTYRGNFVGAHIKVAHISKESFVSWIKLFSMTADEVYTQEIAERFKEKGKTLAEKFICDLKL